MRRYHGHDNAPDVVVSWAQGVTRKMTGKHGWFYAGRLGSELKIGITRDCPFCRMAQQRLRPLGLAYSLDCERHERNMKVALGVPSHGAEFFPDWKDRFRWLVRHRYINTLRTIQSRLMKSG
jgi:hypothetical protein